MNGKTHYWNTLDQDQGQIVEVSRPQILGAAEGACAKKIEKLRLVFDHSDYTWEIKNGKDVLKKGKCHRKEVPSPDEFIALTKKAR